MEIYWEYNGQVRDNLPNGRGKKVSILETTILGTLETKYNGNFINGIKEGFGEWRNSDKSGYIGSWKNGKYHGKGTFFYYNLSGYHGYYKGTWVEDRRWNGLEYDKNNDVVGQYVNGVKVK